MDSHFLRLPPEIRHRVYEEIFQHAVVLVRCELPRECPPALQKWVSRRYYRVSDQVDLSVTLVSKQIRSEAYAIFLATALFDVRFFHVECKRVSVHSECVQDELRRHYIDCLAQVRRVRTQELPHTRSGLLRQPFEIMKEFLEEWTRKNSIIELIIRTRQVRIGEYEEAEIETVSERQQAGLDRLRQFLIDHQHLKLFLEQEIVFASSEPGPKPVWLMEIGVKDGEGRILSWWPEPKRVQDHLVHYLKAVGLRPVSTTSRAVLV